MFHSPFKATESHKKQPARMLLIQDHRRAALTTLSSGFEQHEPSLLDIIRIAAVGLINSSDQSTFQLPPYSHDVTKKVKLVQYLLNAAEEVGRCNYDHAMSLLDICNSASSKTGNLTQRLVYYFAQALCQRVRNKSGKDISSPRLEIKMRSCWEAIASPSPILGVIYEKIPFYQIRQLAGVQAIVESVEKAKRIHIIDLKIRNGMQWAALLQALASRKKGALAVLKITAIVTETENEKSVVQTGERLARFAESMKIPFVFKTVAVHDMLEIRSKKFDIDPREVVAVFCENSLHELIQKPNQLEAFMGVIRNIRPKVMVVVEREANFNSLNFGQRFVEVLFHYGAYFDCIDACLDSDEEGNKMVMEEGLVREQVNDALVKEENVMTRTATIDVWRKFFGRFWMVEGRLSPMIMATVDLLLDRFSEGRSCTVDMNGSSLVVGWKGTPIFSLSTWKFLLVKPLKRSNKRVKLDTCDGDGLLGI